MLQGMMKSGLFTDVTLVCDDNKIFKAHTIALSACSAVFERILNGIPPSSSIIYLKGIHHQEMKSMLDFMYLGVSTLSEEKMKEFLNVAMYFEIKGISKDIEGTVQNLSNDDNTSVHLLDLSKNKHGVLWSQARMRIEMRLRCYLVIGNCRAPRPVPPT